MIIGSGLLANSFSSRADDLRNVCIYAAGVSNSSCKDKNEFARESDRLSDALRLMPEADAFVYFGTCSVADPEAQDTAYVHHKISMERLVSNHPRYLILRLPQVAGRTPNPHTLLNYLFSHISRSEAFPLWRNAWRNIIDVDDVATITHHIIQHKALRRSVLNVANSKNYSTLDIVKVMERVIGKRAIYQPIDKGDCYPIDNENLLSIIEASGVVFDENYLERVISKYYGSA